VCVVYVYVVMPHLKNKKAVNSEGKPTFGHMIIVQAKSFYNEIKIT
jgi:hypothetical protein